MDVQAVTGAAPAPQAPVEGLAAPQSAGAPSGVPQNAPRVQNTGALSPVVAKIFGSAGDSAAASYTVNVSYRVEHDPNIVVTVFTDPSTGREIAQVPAEVMIQIAQFFDKQSGVTLDRTA